ncbi:MAG: YceD family protein [Burkholderiales bacterium]|jgi:uncharacterized protein|nr:YceD family protein [Burkholderiales bacterium]
MSQKINPTQLNLQSLAAASARFEGGLDRAFAGAELEETFARLGAESCVSGGLEYVNWRVQAELRDAVDTDSQVWMHLDVSASLPMVCQRCMTPVMVQVASQQWFRFVADEATAEAEDDVSEEDVLVLSARFNLLALVEDELLMSMPLVPMHGECPVAVVTQVADKDFVDGPVERIHPFADLKLKMKLGGD